MILRCFYPSDVLRRNHYLSRPPANRSELDAATEVILGHFTSSKFLSSIRTNGLIPDTKKERAVDDNLPSDTRSVYLSTTFQRFYADRAAKGHGGEPLILEVKVPKAALNPDEAWITLDEWPTIRDETDALYRTMCGGSCKHLGPVLPANILSIRTADGTFLFGADTE